MTIRSMIYGLNGPAEFPLVCVKKPQGARADELLSIPVRREFGRQSDTRLEQRFPLTGETTRIRHDGADHEVRLLNVCGGGAMVAAAFEPMLWERLELYLGEHGSIECSVLWIKHGRLGLEFAQETRLDCAEDDRAELLREVIRRQFPDAQFEGRIDVVQTDDEDHRFEVRHPFVWFGTLHCEYGSTPARLRNISSGGAMIETSFELAPGAEPYLDLGEAGSIFGTIVWAEGDQSGLRFHEPFDMTRLAHAKPELSSAGGTLIQFGNAGR